MYYIDGFFCVSLVKFGLFKYIVGVEVVYFFFVWLCREGDNVEYLVIFFWFNGDRNRRIDGNQRFLFLEFVGDLEG